MTPRDVEDAPSAKVLMADKGLTPADVTGTGRDGRIMKEDVLEGRGPPGDRRPCRAAAPAAGARARGDPARARSPPRTPPARSGSR